MIRRNGGTLQQNIGSHVVQVRFGTQADQEPLTHGSYQIVRTKIQRVQKRTKSYYDENVTGCVIRERRSCEVVPALYIERSNEKTLATMDRSLE